MGLQSVQSGYSLSYAITVGLIYVTYLPSICCSELRYEQRHVMNFDGRVRARARIVRIPSNLHVCFLNRTYSPLLFRKSTGDATREKCNKTNSCSQRCARLCTGAFCLLAGCTSFVFSSVSFPPSCFVVCSAYSFVAWIFFLFLPCIRGCN